MNYKLLYALENALKSLIRTDGILFTSLSILFSSIIAFFSLNITFFLFHWEFQVKHEAVGDGLLGFQTLSPALLAITLFKYISLLLSIALLFLIISHIKHIFSQYIILQKIDVLTMSLIGQTPVLISLEFALQSLYTVIIIFNLGHFFAIKLLTWLLMDTSKTGIFTDIISSFKPPVYSISIIILLIGIYLFFRVFHLAKKQVHALLQQNTFVE